jgi:hypothetical protein
MYRGPFGSIFLVQITIHFGSMEGHLGQDSWSNLLYTYGVWKTIGVKILGTNYYTFLVYGSPFGSRFFMEITLHLWSM